MRRGLLSSEAQRTPRATLSDAARTEVDYLLARVGRTDPRARL
jgi:4-hydroxy-tetrahydrodipicolinate synthase